MTFHGAVGTHFLNPSCLGNAICKPPRRPRNIFSKPLALGINLLNPWGRWRTLFQIRIWNTVGGALKTHFLNPWALGLGNTLSKSAGALGPHCLYPPGLWNTLAKSAVPWEHLLRIRWALGTPFLSLLGLVNTLSKSVGSWEHTF